jgi:hypothetical protein
MTLTDIHGGLANTAVLFNLILGVWALWRYLRRQGVDSSYWGALVIGELVILAQGLLGGYLWLVGERPARGIHLLYGIAGALVIPGVYAFTRGGDQRRVMLVYGVGLLFLVGILLRSIGTG